ncbi:excinuclease ABC subunit UvrA [candidate division KSB1 bacterium]|nr:excinuclease ABC subunit UvrA [candidate division KSB1 bacterium]
MTLAPSIQIRNARTHNLQGIDLDIPKNRVVVFTGVSGSGKSSLVFDTLYTEAQRQLIETFSTFARRRLPKLSRPPVDEIRNLSTAIVIDQKRLGRTLRSTVGTATEVYTYLRLLYARCAQPFVGWSYRYSFNHPEGMCSACKGLGKRIRIDIDQLLDRGKSLLEGGITHPDFKVGGYYWRDYTSNGLFDPDKKLGDFTEKELHRLLYAENITIEKSHAGVSYSKKWDGIVTRLERLYINKAEDEVPEVRKDAYQRYLIYADCDLCGGTRLNPEVLQAQIAGRSIADLSALELSDLDAFLATVDGDVATPLIDKMRRILGHLIDIGVGYLSLDRAVSTLSGGESQRVKMARQLDCDLTGLMYVLDEPSIGLHPRDIDSLIAMLRRLRDQGNSVLVVEHDPAVILAGDHIIDIGPAAGSGGGKVCFSGSVNELKASDSLTGRYLNDNGFKPPARRTPIGWYEIQGARAHNLKNLDVRIPRGVLTCVTGVAGSGKSSLIHDEFCRHRPEAVVIDQNPVGRSSRSNPLTYTGIFDEVRACFARASGQPASLFSFNSRGACPNCKGQGIVRVEMNFMDDIQITCSECSGKRYTDEVLSLTLQGQSIHDVLCMTAAQALDFFNEKKIRRHLELLERVGLDYLELGQPLSTLSGGEAQRLKLASELGKSGNLYVMDEPTTGLHSADIERLLAIVEQLVEDGNSVVIIEHNTEVISRADWVIDLGPEGGSRGGYLLAEGTPESVADNPRSTTGRYLRRRREEAGE